jgi:hypothetical protein
MVSNDAGSYTLVKAEAAAGGAEGQPLQGYSSQRQLSTKVSGPTLAAASTPRRRVESTASACEIHPLKIQKSRFLAVLTFGFVSPNGVRVPSSRSVRPPRVVTLISGTGLGKSLRRRLLHEIVENSSSADGNHRSYKTCYNESAHDLSPALHGNLQHLP